MIVVERKTAETAIRVELTIGSGRAEVNTGVPFLDHMMTALARYSGLDLSISASGDLRHHIIEDVALTVGEALRRALPATCARYGERTVPMDDALVQAVLDAGGRPFYRGPIRVRSMTTGCDHSVTRRNSRCTCGYCAVAIVTTW
jgi:imidazoleglycerol-phosphate dehydratase